MTPTTGRYAGCAERVHRRSDGGTVTYLAPRLIPHDGAAGPGATVQVTPGEERRPDLLAFRVLQNPLLAYRIADVNGALDPFAMCDRAGRTLVVPAPDFGVVS